MTNDNIVRTTTQLITPSLATEWLEGNVHNRMIRDKRVKQYARDMANDRWLLTHQGIAFDKDGTLVDGQHRLWAIIESGTTVEMQVSQNVPGESQLVIDDHLTRSSLDALKLRGFETSTKAIATVNILLDNFKGQSKSTHAEIQEGLKKFEDVLVFLNTNFKGGMRKITTAPVFAAIARSYYSMPHELLVNFCNVLQTGLRNDNITENQYATVMLLRNHLLYYMQRRGHHVRLDIYGRTIRCLYAFWKDQSISKLFATKKSLFPLPGETFQDELAHRSRAKKGE